MAAVWLNTDELFAENEHSGRTGHETSVVPSARHNLRN
jgi:hypothetical protein